MIKCLIWDLDETLWTGTLVEDGAVHLRPRILEVLKSLDKRGILHSVVSRNEHDQAINKLAELGVGKYFLYPQINWSSKVEGIKQIAAQMNIGLDAVAFIDDNPFERHEVCTYLPEVRVYEAEEYSKLPGYPEFQVYTVTKETGQRREMMISRWRREEAGREFSGSREQFLRSCSMELTVRQARQGDLQRVSELAMRTNQLNNFIERVSEQTILAYLRSDRKELYVAELKDRFGDHGIVAVAMLDYLSDETLDIRLFCISCRIEGRGIGTVFLGTVLDSIQKENPRLQEVNCGYRAASRNRPALILLQLLGFSRKEKQVDKSIYVLSLPFNFDQPNWILIRRTGHEA